MLLSRLGQHLGRDIDAVDGRDPAVAEFRTDDARAAADVEHGAVGVVWLAYEDLGDPLVVDVARLSYEIGLVCRSPGSVEASIVLGSVEGIGVLNAKVRLLGIECVRVRFVAGHLIVPTR